MSGKWKDVVKLSFKGERFRDHALDLRALTELRLTGGEETYDRSARPIEEVLSEIAERIPREEWDKLPEDLNENLDHYLYGVPKKIMKL